MDSAIEGVKFVISAVDATTSTLRTVQTRFKQMANSVHASLRGMRTGFMMMLGPVSIFRNLLSGVFHRAKMFIEYGIFFGIQAAIGGSVYAMISFLKAIIAAETEAETLQTRIKTMFGSSWQRAWQWAVRFAKETPYQLQEVIDQMALMKAYGLDAFRIFRTIGDAAASLGGSESLDRITRAIGQMNAKTRVSAEEMRQLTETGLPAWEILSKGMGRTVGDLMKLAELGQIPAVTAIPILLEGMQKRFGGGMARMMDTIAGKLSNLKDAVWQFLTQIGARIAPTVKGVLGGIIAVVEKLTQSGVGEKIGDWITRVFSEQNIRKIATFFANLIVFAKGSFEWLRSRAEKVGKFIGGVFEWLTKTIMGENGVLGALRKIGKALLYLKVVMTSFAIMQAFAQMAATLAQIPVAGPALAAAAIGTGLGLSAATMVIGLDAIDRLDKLINDAIDKINDTFSPTPPSKYKSNEVYDFRTRKLIKPSPQFPKWPSWGEPAFDSAQPWVDTFMAGFNSYKSGTLLDRIIANATSATAANTSQMLANEKTFLSQIFGGGPRAKLLAGRFGFGSNAAVAGNAQRIEIRLVGGDDYVRQTANQVLGEALRQLGVPAVVRY